MCPNLRHLVYGLHPDRQAPLAVHGVACVDHQIDQRRIELARVGVDEAGLRLGKAADDCDAGAGQRVHHLRDRANALAGVKDLRL